MGSIRKLLGGLAAALFLGVVAPAEAATLYISEFPSAVGVVGSTIAQVYPQPAITDQTVAITGASAQSAAFSSTTHAIQVECDADCSIAIGTNPTATTTNYLMGDGIPYQFVVVPGQKIAVISNSSGGSGSDVNIVAVGGNAVTTSVPVSLVAGSALVGTVSIDQTTPGSTNGVSIVPTSATTASLTPVTSAALESCHVIKASAGNLYSFEVLTQATAGIVLIFNATSAPVDGAVTPIKFYTAAANSTVGAAFPSPINFSTGIVICFSSATTPFTKTASATAAISGDAK